MDAANTVSTENRGIVTKVKAADLPAEASDAFSDAPFEFEETAKNLWDDTQKAYYHSRTANRFSDEYLQLCTLLEKSIRELGSLCLTKAALEHKGQEFPKLSEMSIIELVKMVSFHLRKTHAAFEGIYKDNSILGITYLNWEFRWFTLGSRLKATEVKIQKIKDGKIDVDDMLKENETFKGEPRTNDKPRENQPKSLRVNHDALPIIGSMAGWLKKKERLEEKQEKIRQRNRIRKQKEADRLERAAVRASGIEMFTPTRDQVALANQIRADRLRQELEEELQEEHREASEDEVQQEGIEEAEARRILMEDAMKRGDQEAIMTIPLEDTPTFHARWMRHLEEQEREYLASRHKGPSSDTRKALRGKRKKKKK